MTMFCMSSPTIAWRGVAALHLLTLRYLRGSTMLVMQWCCSSPVYACVHVGPQRRVRESPTKSPGHIPAELATFYHQSMGRAIACLCLYVALSSCVILGDGSVLNTLEQ